jgi:GT2 family glycosyltransferase
MPKASQACLPYATLGIAKSAIAANMDLSIIIVNWNSKTFLRNCLESLYQHCSELSFEIIVVDNATYDGCSDMLASEFGDVIFIQSDKNLGFGGANNLGARSACGRNLLFLNPDTLFLDNSLPVLCTRLDSLPGAGVVGCRLISSDRTLQTSCIQSFPTILNQVLDSDFLRETFPRSRLWGTEPFLASGATPSAVEAVSGACLMIKKQAFDRVGGFTEDYFMYGEDLDLCFKIMKLGCALYYVPEASLIHYGGSSTQKAGSDFSQIMMRASVYRFLQLNRGLGTASLYRVSMAVASILRILSILLLLPFSRGRIVRHGTDSLRKWIAILRWSVGLEDSIARASRQPLQCFEA